jgi:hypothetical protein
MCLSVVWFRDLHIVPTFDLEQGWSGAYRCPRDRASSYGAARAALATCRADQLADFFTTVARWGPPLVALRPFTAGTPLEDAARRVLDLLDQGIVRLAHAGPPSGDGPEPAFFAVDIVLAFLIAPRGHYVDRELLPLLRQKKYRPILVEAAVRYAMCALQPGDRVDTDRWAELLALSEVDKLSEDTILPEPSADEIAHWREVVFGGDSCRTA